MNVEFHYEGSGPQTIMEWEWEIGSCQVPRVGDFVRVPLTVTVIGDMTEIRQERCLCVSVDWFDSDRVRIALRKV